MKKSVKKSQKSAKSEKSRKFTFDRKWFKSHWEGHQGPLKLKNRFKNSKTSVKSKKMEITFFLKSNFFPGIFLIFYIKRQVTLGQDGIG